MEKKIYYEAPEMEQIILMNESAMLTESGSWDKSIKEGTKWGDSSTDYEME